MAPRVGLLVTCLVDLLRPSVGLAAVRLLEHAGCRVEVPAQTCCGQPAYNSGARADAQRLARAVIAAFEGFDFVVAPSGSCAGMLRVHYPLLLAEDADWAARAHALGCCTHELCAFLCEVMGARVEAACSARAAYHDSCSARRELGIEDEPRALLGGVEGLELVPLEGAEECCGFGGLFCLKYPEIAGRMAEAKLAAAERARAELVLSADLGCLLHLAGKASRLGSKLAFRHVAEVLAGDLGGPPIGAPQAGR